MARRLLGSRRLDRPLRMSAQPYDEMSGPDGSVRGHYQAFAEWLRGTPKERIAQKRGEAERAFHRVGITFAVYGEDSGNERLIPFDIVPRIIPADEWTTLEAGLRQRVHTLDPHQRRPEGVGHRRRA